MRQRCNQMISFLLIIVLLPCIITVFINGPSVMTSARLGNDYVKVKVNGNVKEVPLDTYCIGLLAKEIPIGYQKETIKAQAVLVRTSLYKKMTEEGKDVVFGEDFWSEKEMEKQWGGKFGENYEKLEDAWEETEGQVLTYNDKPIQGPFHRLSNGSTRDGKEVFGTDDYPYLKKKECPKDVEAKDAMQTFMLEKKTSEIVSNDSAGYVKEIKEDGKACTGEEFREKYGLASSCFTLQDYEGKVRVTTKGVGHGIGMSQYTAEQMAKEKKPYTEILSYFFEGSTMKEVAEIL